METTLKYLYMYYLYYNEHFGAPYFTDRMYKWETCWHCYMKALNLVGPVTKTQQQLWHNIYNPWHVLWRLSSSGWKPPQRQPFTDQEKLFYFRLFLTSPSWFKRRSEKQENICNLQREETKIRLLTWETYRCIISNNVTEVDVQITRLAYNSTRELFQGEATSEQEKGEKWQSRLFVFAAHSRQQIKVTECKRASQGRAEESIWGEKRRGERQINVQTTQPCNGEENTSVYSGYRTLVFILHCYLN